MPHSPLASPTAAIAALQRHGLRTRKALGQHLLVDDNVVGRILDLAALTGSEAVLEIGPGIGTLTAALAPRSGAVVAVERDGALLPVLAETLSGSDNVRVVHADAVSVPVSELETSLGMPTALVANLPYSVAATVVLRFLEEMPSLRSATVMVQAEVADRMTAEPGCKDYGAYTVKLRLLAEPAGRFAVARSCFLPPPRVDSAVLRLERISRPEPAAVLRDAAAVADAAFSQRRKTVRNSLAAGLRAPASEVESILAEVGIEPSRRAETLAVDSFVALGVAAREHGLLP